MGSGPGSAERAALRTARPSPSALPVRQRSHVQAFLPKTSAGSGRPAPRDENAEWRENGQPQPQQQRHLEQRDRHQGQGRSTRPRQGRAGSDSVLAVMVKRPGPSATSSAPDREGIRSDRSSVSRSGVGQGRRAAASRARTWSVAAASTTCLPVSVEGDLEAAGRAESRVRTTSPAATRRSRRLVYACPETS